MVRMFQSSYRSTSVPVGLYEPFEFNHLKKADVALHDLNSLTQASRRHDRDFIDDLNAKLIVDSSLGLPPRSVRKHYSVTPSLAPSHVSRRIFLEGGAGGGYEGYGGGDDGGDVSESLFRVHAPVTSSYVRGYSLPPATYNEVLLQNGVQVGRNNPVYGEAKRLSLAADTAVRQAQRDVNRVERELGLSYYDQPSVARKHRSISYSGPREYSIAPRPAVVYHHSPSSAHYYQHHSHQLPRYEVYESAPSHRPLYPPEKLVRCLTETPVTRISGRSVDDIVGLRSRSVLPYIPQLHIVTPTPVVTRSRYATATTHRQLPRYSRSSSVSSSLQRLPNSVGHWYNKPTSYYYGSSYDLGTPAVTSYQYQPIRSHVSLTSSATPTSASVSLGPSPPYHTRVIGEGSYETYSSSSNSGADYHRHHQVPYFSSWTPSLAPTYHQHTFSRSHRVTPSTVYAAQAWSLSPSLDKPLENHVEVSEARKKVREVLCKVPERIVIG